MSNRNILIILTSAFCALMANLDISIINAVLPIIQGEFGTSMLEGVWISTSYLVAEIIMIPLAAWLTKIWGLKRLLFISIFSFLLFSLMCGFASSLSIMIIGRIGQGMAGGIMIPLAQSILRMELPKEQLSIGMSIFGSILLLGPLIGPYIGGVLTEIISWRYAFFINIPICLMLLFFLNISLDSDKKEEKNKESIDWLGIIGIILFLGPLVSFLSVGKILQWFDSKLVFLLFITFNIGLILITLSQIQNRTPILNLKLFKNINFLIINIVGFFMGLILYCITYLLPQFLDLIPNNSPIQIGLLLLYSAIPSLFLIPVMPKILEVVNKFILIFVGLIMIAISCLLESNITIDSIDESFILTQVLRGFGQVLVMIPLTQLAITSVPLKNTSDAAGLYNTIRNIGGILGLTILSLFYENQKDTNIKVISESVKLNSSITHERIENHINTYLLKSSDYSEAHLKALKSIKESIENQAIVISFSNIFYILFLISIICAILVLLLNFSTNKYNE